MTENKKVKNLTESVISIRIDNIQYEMLPKGHADPETLRSDTCFIRPEHMEHPKVQHFLLKNPPQLAVVETKKITSAKDMENALDAALVEGQNRIIDFKNRLDKVIAEKQKNFGDRADVFLGQIDEKFKKVNSELNSVLDELKKVRDAVKDIKVPESVQGQGTTPSTGSRKKTGRAASNLFSN